MFIFIPVLPVSLIISISLAANVGHESIQTGKESQLYLSMNSHFIGTVPQGCFFAAVIHEIWLAAKAVY
jgi:hypothetical protein